MTSWTLGLGSGVCAVGWGLEDGLGGESRERSRAGGDGCWELRWWEVGWRLRGWGPHGDSERWNWCTLDSMNSHLKRHRSHRLAELLYPSRLKINTSMEEKNIKEAGRGPGPRMES